MARPGWLVLLVVMGCAPPAWAAPVPDVLVSPSRVPARDTAQIAQYGDHLVWLDSLPDAAGHPASAVLDRNAKRTTLVRLDPAIGELDVGPDADGHPTAVYVRCTPGCDVFAYDLSSRRETKVVEASQAGVSEHYPTIWGRRIAFERRNSVILATRGSAKRTIVARGVDPDDIELGAKHVAYVGLFDGDAGNGTLQVRLRGLASGREQVLASRTIAEETSTGFGALTFQSRVLSWQARGRHGCSVHAPRFSRYVVRGGSGRPEPVSSTSALTAVRWARIVPPDTPGSEDCGAG